MVCTVCAAFTFDGVTNVEMARDAVHEAAAVQHEHENPNPCWFGGHGCQGMKVKERQERALNDQAVVNMLPPAVTEQDKRLHKMANKRAIRSAAKLTRTVWQPKE